LFGTKNSCKSLKNNIPARPPAYQSSILYSLFILSFLFYLPGKLTGQAGQWTWMHGPKGTNSSGNYGTQTIPNNSNNPHGLFDACQWTDTNGVFWLFGGVNWLGQKYADLWRYLPTTNQWTWMNGTATPNEIGNYGTQGVSSLSNIPPARSHGMATWTDKNNNLWFFGGSNNGMVAFNDLWKYNIATGEWTWVKGPKVAGDTGRYGTMGVPDMLNLPPSRVCLE
jgi:hypothetical protein